MEADSSLLLADDSDSGEHDEPMLDPVRAGGKAAQSTAAAVNAGGGLDVPAKGELAAEQERWMEGQRRMKQLEIDGRESESQFKVHHTMLRKRLKEMENQMCGREELILELERDREKQQVMQQQYASVLAELRSEVEEKERSVETVKRQRGRTEDERRAIAEQLVHTEQELAELKERVKEHKGAMKRIKSADRKIEELSEELRRSKAERSAVANQIKLDVGENDADRHQLLPSLLFSWLPVR